jgi:hypothetical protein
MKNRLVFPFIVLLLVFSNIVNAQRAGFRIEVTIDFATDGEYILGYYYGDSRFAKDTALMANSQVVFAGNEKLQEGVYFIQGPDSYFDLFVADQNFSISTRAPEFTQNLETTGSQLNTLFNQYQRNQEIEQREIEKMKTSFQASAIGFAQFNNFMKDVQLASNNFNADLANRCRGTLLEDIIRAGIKPDMTKVADNQSQEQQVAYYKKHFFDNVNFYEQELLRAPILIDLYEEYLSVLTRPESKARIESVDKILENARASSKIYIYSLRWIAQKYEHLDKQVFVHVADNYILNDQSGIFGESIKSQVRRKADALRNRRP